MPSAAAALGVAGGAAYATIPDNSRGYTACVLNKVGTVRLIDPSLPATNPQSHCTSLETTITWNQQGQPGPQVPKGDAGAHGATPQSIMIPTRASVEWIRSVRSTDGALT